MDSNLVHAHVLELCRRAVAADSGGELEPIIQELKDALHEHTEYLRGLAEAKLVPSLVSHETGERLADLV
jgi:hypothetical protein